MTLALYGYARSSAAFRLRIGLNLKGLGHDTVVIDLRSGAQKAPDYLALNPQGLVPLLRDGDEVLSQSLAILEYLEEIQPEPPFLPSAPVDRARVRALALAVACEIHPLNNLRVLNYLTGDLGQDEDTKLAWYRHWIAEGLGGLEALTRQTSGKFSHGDTPGLADICLVPQIFNARRFDCPLEDYPVLMRVFENCMALEAFDRAQPAKQPDFAG
jgi:maleylacetoacetate isomerase